MSGKNNKKKRAEEARRKAKTKKNIITGIVTALVLILGIGFVLDMQGSNTEVYASGVEINKADVESNGHQVYPYKIGGTNLEVIAVKGTDGSIRTAFNTCQICYSSGRGYYQVKGDTLVCNNCGNVYTFDQVEREQGGCNPVPIMSGDKTDNGSTITITHDLIQENIKLFNTWK